MHYTPEIDFLIYLNQYAGLKTTVASHGYLKSLQILHENGFP